MFSGDLADSFHLLGLEHDYAEKGNIIAATVAGTPARREVCASSSIVAIGADTARLKCAADRQQAGNRIFSQLANAEEL